MRERGWNKAHSTCRRSFLVRVYPPYFISIRPYFLASALSVLTRPNDGYERTKKMTPSNEFEFPAPRLFSHLALAKRTGDN